MTKVLLLTVGGSPQPILKSIKAHKPGYTIFICSDTDDKRASSINDVIGEGNVLKSSPDLKCPDSLNIVTQAGLLSDQYETLSLTKLDDLSHCYRIIKDCILEVLLKFPGAELVCDYTGGTKTMAAALVMAAVDDGNCTLAIVSGARTNKEKIIDGLEQAVKIPFQDIHALRKLELASKFVASYDYGSAEQVLDEFNEAIGEDSLQARIRKLLFFSRAFNYWDRFEYLNALNIMNNLLRQDNSLQKHFLFLKRLSNQANSHGYEIVEDLLLNAERRAAQGRYDDAVGRLYRALELTAQVWLRQEHGIDNTGKVLLEKIPDSPVKESLRKSANNNEEVELGLFKAWEVIEAFGDELEPIFKSQKSKLLDELQIRNNSLFAHGITSIGEYSYKVFSALVLTFLRQVVRIGAEKKFKKHISPSQFPQSFHVEDTNA